MKICIAEMFSMAFALIAICLVVVGCSDEKIGLTPAPAPQHTTGWVTVVRNDYIYHITILEDGVEREFFACQPLPSTDDGEQIQITFTGPGTAIGEGCASDLTIRPKDGYINSRGKRVWTGTTKVAGEFPEETLWLKPDHSRCGTLHHDSGWQVSAYEDMSQEHYFSTKAEAINWIADWCKP